jgi:hypothetical protein
MLLFVLPLTILTLLVVLAAELRQRRSRAATSAA